MVKYRRFILYFSLISFFLNFIWEYLHLYLFKFPDYIQGLGLTHFSIAVLATIGDVVIIFLVHLFLSRVYHNKFWERKWNSKEEFAVVAVAIICIVVCERIALATGLWSYSEHLIVVPFFGINLSTFLQFVIIPIGSLYLSSKLVRQFKNSSKV